MHGYYYTENKRNTGKQAEYYYQDTHWNVRSAYSRRFSALPFIVATPDLLEPAFEADSSQERVVVEIKHSRRKKDLIRLQRCRDTQAEIQLRVSMSVFGYKYGKLVLIYRRPYPYNDYEVHETVIIKDMPDFLQENYLSISYKYFHRVLVPYFTAEFGLSSEFVNVAREEAWFIKQVESWKKKYENK